MGSGKENRLRKPDVQGHTFVALTSWPSHTIVLVNERYFDPSYGTGPFTGPKDYENKSIHALQTRNLSPEVVGSVKNLIIAYLLGPLGRVAWRAP